MKLNKLATKILFSILSGVWISVGLTGCGITSWFSGSPDNSSPKEQATEQTAEPAAQTAQPQLEATPEPAQKSGDEFVEITWKVSDRKITAYHIHYGAVESDLPHHIRIPVSEIETIEDPVSGKAHRVRIKVSEPGAAIYVAVQAENEFGTSAQSAPMRVEVTH